MREDDPDERPPWQKIWSFRGDGKQAFRAAAMLGGAIAAVIMIMAIFTDPIPPLGRPAAFGTGDWSLVPARQPCRASDDKGFVYEGRLQNHSEVTRDFTISVSFEVEGRREALGNAQLQGIAAGSSVPLEVAVTTTFPSGLPTVRCGVQVRHVPAAS